MNVWLKRGLWFLVGLFLFLGVAFVVAGYSWWQSIPDRFTLLLLGKGGTGHEAPDLTDTMMVAIIKKDAPIQLVSLPRDIWVMATQAKLNASYYYDLEKGEDFTFTQASLAEITGQQADGIVVFDFTAFQKVIDALGGIKIEVKNGFTDPKYPIAGKEKDLCNGDKTLACRYETLVFEPGWQTMSGERALKFVRSRNAEGDEGTDLAREARQQLVIEAIKNQLLSKEVVLHPSVWKHLYLVVLESVETTLTYERLRQLAGLVLASKGQMITQVIPDEFLLVSQNNPKYGRQYVFLPKEGSWEALHQWFANL